jgi:hypothetical protein
MAAFTSTTGGYITPFSKCGVKTVTANYVVDPLVDDVIYANSTAGSLSVTLPALTAANPCASGRITIKRVLPDGTLATQLLNNLTYVRVVSVAGIDNAPAGDIQLALSTAYGAITGESVTVAWDGTTWRII